ncbi:DUF1127 domain-containing protein [Paracoccus spongiarum]|uniref:DUF1127 domain-containing protein n=1 Tax=Paracoccus spongiarum TaxID=3064387 RepID=A0ABT9JEB8_9RHOB|nr:DUF1127 domain-containing protein [Paracoccus sp. 2205BS29-5]MDP5308173.1 DUF1127 domain-containing protein [Paracoccus sp. 2205BS29-5]
MTTIAISQGHGFADFLADLRSALAGWKARRVTRAALNRLSERDLEDIGMNRADIDTVVAGI